MDYFFDLSAENYNCVIVKCADTGSVLPANGVMVKAVVLLAGLMIDKTEFSVVVSIMDIPIN